MSILLKQLDFVKEQIAFHEKRAAGFANVPHRQRLHLATAEKFKSLLQDLESADAMLDDLSRSAPPPLPGYRQLSLKLEDIAGLSDELINELSISDGDRTEFAILTLLNESGGVLSLDKLLIGLYKMTGEIHKRQHLVSRLYRMTQKGLVWGVPNKKGFYSNRELSDDELNSIFS